MRSVSPAALTRAEARFLLDRRSTIRARKIFGARVEEAKSLWKKFDRSRGHGKAIDGKLREACGRLARCSYCEQDRRSQIDHIAPKALYPDRAFEWINLIYACGPCNNRKLDKWLVFDRSGKLIRAVDVRGAEPRKGRPGFIDPRKEEPLDFFDIDVVDTFRYRPAAEIAGEKRLRAEFTIEVLGLNQPELTLRWKQELRVFLHHLGEYVEYKKAGKPRGELNALEETFREDVHRVVWRAVVRTVRVLRGSASPFRDFGYAIEQADKLLRDAPEAEDWWRA